MPLVFLAMLGGCSTYGAIPADAYRHLGDRFRVYFSAMLGPPCGVWRGPQRARGLPAGECYVFGERREFGGALFDSGYGNPRFHAGSGPLKEAHFWSNSSDLVSDRYQLAHDWTWRPNQPQGAPERRAYRVRFLGRETRRFTGSYVRSVVIVDEMLSVERIAVPRD